MKKVFIMAILLLGVVSAAWTQVDDVTLVVNGEGATKDEATTKALRSAIEQAFGVFVSANTEILNDELVKDEIATVSSGNVKSYKELGSIKKENGNTEVSLQATVSVKRLTSFAQSHGSICEFAGATFASNLKLVELNKENTTRAFDNLNKQIESFEGDLHDCEIELGAAQSDGTVEVTLKYYTNQNTASITDLIVSTLEALSLPSEEVDNLNKLGIKTYKYIIMSGADVAMSRRMHRKFDDYLFLDVKSRFFPKSYYFYSPLNLKDVRGRMFRIRDNMDNLYDMACVFRWVDGSSSSHAELCSQQQWWELTGCFIGQYDCMQENIIYIPKSFKGSSKRFKPKMICKIDGFIQIPLSIISQVTSINVF